jgi:hypothetical protein
MNEWDESLKNRELTFIWPLINWYNSPEKSGIRFLPLFWFRNYLESASDLSVNYEVPIGPPMPELLNPDKVMVKTKIILPLLYYSHERSRPRDNHTISDFSISPFHYYNYQEENGRPAKSLWIPLIPLIYYTSGIVPGASGQMEEHKLLVAAGLYVYRYKPDEIYKSYLFWLYQKYEYPREEMSETWLLYGLYKKISFKGKNESRFLPFYYYLNEPPKWQFSLLMGMFKYTTEKSVLANDLYPDTSLKILYGMFYTGAEFHRKSIFLDKQSASIDIKTRRVFILPLLLYYSGDTGLDNSVTHTDYMQIWPFWYRDYDETGTNKTAAEKDPATKALEVKSEPKTYHATLWFPILPVFYRYADNERTHVNLLGLFDWEKNYRTEAMRLWVLPLFYLNSFKEKTESRFLPLYYYLNEPKKWELSLLLGLFSHASENSHRVRTPHQDSSWKVLYGIFYTSAEYRQKYIYLENRGANIEIKNRFFMFLPLLYFYSADESIDQNINYQDKMQIWPLYYKSYDEKETKNGSGTLSGTRVYHSSFWFPIVPLIYYYTENERTHLNLFWFVDWERNYRLDTKRLWIFPFFYNKTSPQESTQFIMGLYLTREKFYNRQNIMYLYDQKEYDQPGQPYANFRQTSMLLGMVDYKTSETIKRFRLFYGLLMDYKNYPQSERYKFDMLWFIYNNENTGYQFKHSFFLTFYYTSYNNNPDKWSLFSPLGLSYINHSEYEKFDFIGMGLLWYRNDKLKANYERQMLLLGIPYFYVKKPERGYESRGSLWGLLWEYETEKETNFAKLSILKFIYKRVDMNGNVYHKILGITF